MKYFCRFKTIALATLALGLVSLTGQATPPAPPNVAGQEDIRDIRPPVHIAAPFPWVAWTSGTLSAAALYIVSWKLLRRKRRKQTYEIALERLENTRALMRENDAEPFCLAVSDIVREFIEGTLPVRAVHRTTNEFLRDLAGLSYQPLVPHRGALSNFLWHCDLAKFARWSLTVPQMEALLASAKQFVIDVSKPAPAEASSSAMNPVATTA
jgi:hypothetical protein